MWTRSKGGRARCPGPADEQPRRRRGVATSHASGGFVRRGLLAAIVAALAVTGIVLFVVVPRWSGRSVPGPAAPATTTAEAASRTVRATIYYVVEEGTSLVGVEREVAYAESPVEQARHVVEAQLESTSPPLGQPVPEGTRLRTLFLTEKGEAYVDLSPEIADKHPGGSLEELFTVYAIVNVLTVNLPSVKSVQILVDGREVDTLAGHIDLRRPLTRNLTLVKGASATATPAQAGTR